ncbi:MAG: rhomboid family intramembrane serine protease [Bacteroidales bacterium]|nr:rhomboid family intramembrane serine protease [Bacteroidales bacterium]
MAPRFLQNIPVVTRNLLYLNLIMFVATLINEDFMIGTFAMFYPKSTYFHWWQILTHMFMHGGFWHILFNMYTLVMFGSVVERELGTKDFIAFYLITGLGAVALHTGVEWLEITYLGGNLTAAMMTPMVGASGAIYGVLVAFAMLYPEARLTLIFPPVTLDAKWWVGIFVALELFLGITGTQISIAHFAHLGGALFGFLLVRRWKRKGSLM